MCNFVLLCFGYIGSPRIKSVLCNFNFKLLALDVYFNVDGGKSSQSVQPVSEIKAIFTLLLKLPFIKPGVIYLSRAGSLVGD